ncbi:MAG: hypothetical protein CL916_14125, partial [Deltaproteobacteria bacterium]|nr:hypothetical protein [Deltaproteobacteria bacterium]
AQTEPFEPSEWQATLRYVEKDLDTHVEEAQERVITQKKRKEEEQKNRIAIHHAQKQAENLHTDLLELQDAYDSTFTQTIEDLLLQVERQEEEKGNAWSARITNLIAQKEEAHTQAKYRKEQAEQQKKEEERQRKLEEERQRIAAEKQELEEKRQRIAMERARIEEERQRRERERKNTERKKEIREQYDQCIVDIRNLLSTSSDSITLEALSHLSNSYPNWIEDEVETQEQWVNGLEERYQKIIQESLEREKERKRIEEERKEQEILRLSIENTIREYNSKLSTITQWIEVDPQTQKSHEELKIFCNQREKESLEKWSLRLKEFVPLFENAYKEAQEREEERQRIEKERQRQKEERRKKEEEERLEKEKQEERKALLAKQPTDLGQALSIIHRLYDLYRISTENELRPYLKKNLRSVKGWQIALLEELCFSSSCLLWLKNNEHEKIRIFITEQSEHYNKDTLKSMLLLLASSLSLTPPQLETPNKQKNQEKEQPSTLAEPANKESKTEGIPKQWQENPNWKGPAQSPIFTSGRFQASKNIKKYTLLRQKDSRPLPFRADPNITTASVIGYLFSQQLIPIRMDLHGVVLGWYRFEREGKPVSGSVPLSVFSDTKPLQLQFIPNKAQKVYLSIPDQNIETETIVGSTVPFLSLIEIFGSRFSLPYRKWSVSIEGTKVDPYHMLCDFDQDEQIRITMS